MMCTAAVCSISTQTTLVGFDDEESPLSHKGKILTPSRRKWRTTNSSDELAALMFQLSPLNETLTRVSRTHLTQNKSIYDLKSHLTTTFDVVSSLPLEVSLRILGYLDSQDLCNVCMVSRRWYIMAQDRTLKKRRQLYIKDLRAHFKLSKENYSGNTFTPPHSTVIRNMTTPALTSLNHRYTPLTHSYPRSTVSPSPTPSLSHLRTPGPSLSSMVEKLSIDGPENDIRRCLFPGMESPGMKRPNSKDILIGPIPRRPDSLPNCSVDRLVGKKTSRTRLRRL